jgi:hypothetical protein
MKSEGDCWENAIMKTELECFDKQGEPISLNKYRELMNDNTYRVIGLTGGKIRVSTVWLGISHGQNDKGAPLIFETMVFGGPDNGECVRYATEKEAVRGHLLRRKRAYKSTMKVKGEP